MLSTASYLDCNTKKVGEPSSDDGNGLTGREFSSKKVD